MTVSPTLIKWGAIGLGLLAAGFFIDHRARSQVHEDYRVKNLEAIAERREKDVKAIADQAKRDGEALEWVVHYQGLANTARSAEYRVRNKLKELSVSCDSASSPGCEAANRLGGLLEQCIAQYRELGERSGQGFAAAKKCEGRYEVIEQNQ